MTGIIQMVMQLYVNGLPVARTDLMNNDQRINDVHRIIIGDNSLDIAIDELRIAPIAFHRNQISLDYFLNDREMISLNFRWYNIGHICLCT